MFSLEDSPYSPSKEEENSLGYYKSLGAVAAVAAVGAEVGPIYCCGGLRRNSRKRGGGGMPLLVAALIYIGV